VLDVPPGLGARVRLLAAGDADKNDPSDARPVAAAALRPAGVRDVRPDDHAAVLKVWSRRYRDLGRTRAQVVCRRHAVPCDLVPGGVSRPIYAAYAARILQRITPPDAVAAARCELAAAFPDDLRRIDAQIRETRKKPATAVQAAGTSLTGLSGVGPVIAAAVTGDVRDVSRFGGRDHFAAGTGTAPIEVSCGPRKGLPAEQAREPAARPRHPAWPRSPGSATGTARAAPATARNRPKARRPKKPCAH
jgi:transposase